MLENPVKNKTGLYVTYFKTGIFKAQNEKIDFIHLLQGENPKSPKS